VNYGGGLLANDTLTLDVDVLPRACAVLTTQASTKVYKSPDNLLSSQTLTARVGPDGFLALIPDPVTCYANSLYRQRQTIRLTASSSLLLLDWCTAGRIARDERWQFTFFDTFNDVYVDDRLVFRDRMVLSNLPDISASSDLLPTSSGLSVAQKLGNCNVIATLLLLGPALKELSHSIHAQVSSQPAASSKAAMDDVLVSSSLLSVGDVDSQADSGSSACPVVVRLASSSTEKVTGRIAQLLEPLSSLLSVAPWCRR